METGCQDFVIILCQTVAMREIFCTVSLWLKLTLFVILNFKEKKQNIVVNMIFWYFGGGLYADGNRFVIFVNFSQLIIVLTQRDCR